MERVPASFENLVIITLILKRVDISSSKKKTRVTNLRNSINIKLCKSCMKITIEDFNNDQEK